MRFSQRSTLRQDAISVLAFSLLIGVLMHPARGQQSVNASVNDLLRYGSGEEAQIIGVPAVPKHYLEEQAAAQITVGDFLVGFRYQLDDPTELYGQSFQGIRKRYVEYRKDGLSVRAGDLNGLFGRGLSMNLFENRAIYFDTELDGVKLAYRTRWGNVAFDGTALTGKMDFTDFSRVPPSGAADLSDPTKLPRPETYHIQAGEIGISPHIDGLQRMRVGLSWLHTSGLFPSQSEFLPSDTLDVTLPALNVNLQTREWQWYVEYAAKRSDVSVNDNYHTGGILNTGGVYSSLSFTRPSFGATLEYKNYHFDVVDRASFRDEETFRSTKALPFQNAPILFKEHSYTLATRVQHPVNFNDELGFQFDGFYALTEEVLFNLNMSCASEHVGYVPGSTGIDSVLRRSSSSISLGLPSSDPRFSPFWELFAEADITLSEHANIKIAFDRNDIFIASNVGVQGVQREGSTAFPLMKGTISLSEAWSMTVNFENQWVYNPSQHADTTAPHFFSRDSSTYFSQLFGLGVANTQYGSLTALYEWSTQTDDISGRRNWFLVEGSTRIGPSNTIIVSVGSERGGIRCSNGICRTLNPFSGWRLTLASRL